jgi:hypothetical protein
MTARLATLLILVSPLAAAAAEPITPAQYAKVRELVRPDVEDAKWLQVPWRTSLWEARRDAAREGKPILLWEMDGHPLGCT